MAGGPPGSDQPRGVLGGLAPAALEAVNVRGAGTLAGEELWAWRRSGLDLVRRARKMIDEQNPSCELAVDGGIRPNNLAPIVACDPDVLVFSTALYRDPDGIAAAVRKCRKAIDEAARQAAGEEGH